MPKQKQPIYLLDPELKWQAFKMLQELVKGSGPVLKHGDKMLWQMMKKKMIYCWFDFKNFPNDMKLGLELPKNRRIELITNPKLKK